MQTMRAKFAVSVIGSLLLGAIGCGLISTDIAKFTFRLPQKRYVFAAPNVGSIPPGQVTCGAGGAVATCPAPLTCDAGICTGHVPVSVVQKMDFKKDAAELANYSSLADLKIESITYNVVSTANIGIPTIDIYMAPLGVVDPASPEAKKFGTVPAIAAGESRSGDVIKEPDADTLFTTFATDLSMPFNFIAATNVPIPTGSPTPTGMVEIKITGLLSATPFF
jgi:hypothetical protein